MADHRQAVSKEPLKRYALSSDIIKPLLLFNMLPCLHTEPEMKVDWSVFLDERVQYKCNKDEFYGRSVCDDLQRKQ